MRTCKILSFMLILTSMLAGCAGYRPGYEPPQVNVTSFALAPETTGFAPRFNIGLQIINPNRADLAFEGMSYSLEIEGNRILSGATNDLPRVPGYGMADFTIQASPNLIGSARLLTDLFSRQRSSLGYTFRARLDTGGLVPFINLEEEGKFDLSGTGQRPGQ
jgi:LEA14-like dessication related protein